MQSSAIAKNPEAFQSVKASVLRSEEEAVEGVSTDFDSALRSILRPSEGNQISEEELFAALIYERLLSTKGEETATAYQNELEMQKAKLQKADGFIPMEEAALKSLKVLVKESSISAEEGDQIYSSAFSAAQIDQDHSTLFDNRGGAGDASIAVADMEAALMNARVAIEAINASEEGAAGMNLSSARPTGTKGMGSIVSALPTPSPGINAQSDTGPSIITPQGTFVDGAEGFLFKPITENEGKLAVLLPAEMTGAVLSVILKDEEDNTLEEARLQTAGIAETGREKWVFANKGAAYPKDINVEVRLADGSSKIYKIADPSKRYD